MMATSFLNVIITTINDNGECNRKYNSPIYIQFNDSAGNILKIQFYSEQGGTLLHEVNLTSSCEFASLGSLSLIVTLGADGWILRFPSQADLQRCQSLLKNFRTKLKNSVFTQRTEESSAMQYFQFYGYLSQQQNMMQDYIRTSTYQRAILANISDFKDKIVLDVGAGSGILSFFAIQAGARKVYAVEASSMAEQAQNLVFANKCAGKIVVISGKIEEINLPEKVDVIISEPMGYMLFNERMLETYLHAKKWLIPDGKMYPAKSDLHVAPFSDDTLYMEQYNKANFWYQTCFHGVDLTRLRDAAINEYFRQPIVDTFDIRICMARSQKHTVDFLLANEQDLHKIVIPLEFTMLTSGTVHGLAFWFDVAFVGSAQTIWLSTSPTEPLTHWYQVRCLLHNPVFVKEGQILTGRVALIANVRQSYDVEMELCVAETGTRSVNTLDLKNPYFRYTGQAPTPPPGNNTTSPSENYWQQIDATNSQTSINGIVVNGVDELSMQAQNNFVNVGNSDQHLGQQRAAQSRLSANMPNTSLGGGVSPAIFTQQQQQVVMGNTSHYPVNTSFMIGDYVTPGNIIIPTQGMQASYR